MQALNDTLDVVDLVEVRAGCVDLEGRLAIPDGAYGLIVFGYVGESSRETICSRCVAQNLQEKGLGTFVVDLLREEDRFLDFGTSLRRYVLGTLRNRFAGVVRQVRQNLDVDYLPLGCFGVGGASAPALAAAAQLTDTVDAVVAQGGRPAHAGAISERLTAPTLIIGELGDRRDPSLDRKLLKLLEGPAKHVRVEDATPTFESSEAMVEVADVAQDWFARYLGTQRGTSLDPKRHSATRP